MASNFGIDLGPILQGVAKFETKVAKLITSVMQYNAASGEAWMKKNAPWTDQSYNARNGLSGRYSFEGTRHEITYAHGMPYGIWLEVRFSGRYAIVTPTIEKYGKVVMTQLDGGIGRL